MHLHLSVLYHSGHKLWFCLASVDLSSSCNSEMPVGVLHSSSWLAAITTANKKCLNFYCVCR